MKTRSRPSACTFAMIACLAAPAALAQGAVGGPGPMSFADFDQDANGIVTVEEFNRARALRMESRAATGAPMRGAANAPTFASLDRDGDGQLTPDELAAGQQARRQGRPGMGMPPGMGPGMGRGMGPGMGRNMPAFTDFDLNTDGSLTEQELSEARAQRIRERSQQGYRMRNLANAPAFGDLDLDGNGVVSPGEFAEAQARHRLQMMGPPMAPPPPWSAQPQ